MKYLVITVVGALILMVAIPLVSAFEATAINVTSYVKLPIVSGKTFAAAPETMDLDGDGDIDCDGINDSGPLGDLADNTPPGVGRDNCYNPTTAFISAPGVVRKGEKVCWNVRLQVSNATSTTMTQVSLMDRFSAELNAQSLTDLPVEVFTVKSTKGATRKRPEQSATTINWWVDYFLGNDVYLRTDLALPPDYDGDGDPAFLSNHEIEDNDGNSRTPASGSSQFVPGESATAEMLVCTRLNPAGHQEYTSPGCYNFNSGIVIKWLFRNDPEGDQWYRASFEGNKLWVAAQDGSMSQGAINSCIAPNPP